MDVQGHKGFIVTLRDGRAIREDEVIDGVTHDWKYIKKISNNLKDITSLQIRRGKVFHTVSVDGKNVDYIHNKTCSSTC